MLSDWYSFNKIKKKKKKPREDGTIIISSFTEKETKDQTTKILL